MVHEIFDVDSVKLVRFFPIETCNQLGTGAPYELSRFQRGYGLKSIRTQRGTGVGNVLRSLWRFLVPIAREASQVLTKEGASTGARILQNIAQGADIKEAVVTEGRQALRNVAGIASEKLKQQEGSGIVYRKGRPQKRLSSLDTIRLAGRSVSNSSLKKKRKKDNLGFF